MNKHLEGHSVFWKNRTFTLVLVLTLLIGILIGYLIANKASGSGLDSLANLRATTTITRAFSLGTDTMTSTLPRAFIATATKASAQRINTPAILLPKAMTATPKTIKDSINNDSIANFIQSYSKVSPIGNLSIQITTNNIIFSGTIADPSTSLSEAVEVVGKPYIEDGRLRIKVESVKINGMDLKDSLGVNIEAEVNKAFGDMFPGKLLKTLSLTNGLMYLTSIEQK